MGRRYVCACGRRITIQTHGWGAYRCSTCVAAAARAREPRCGCGRPSTVIHGDRRCPRCRAADLAAGSALACAADLALDRPARRAAAKRRRPSDFRVHFNDRPAEGVPAPQAGTHP